MLDLYSSSVPVFSRYLQQLSGILGAAEGFAQANNHCSAQGLINHQLQEGMLPAGQQANVAASFAERAFYLLQGKALQASNYDIESFASIQRNVNAVAALIAGLTPEMLIPPQTELTVGTGDVNHRLTAEVYLTQLCLPNFFFHISMCYALFKQQGVPLGKHDFDGFHQFKEGTRFV